LSAEAVTFVVPHLRPSSGGVYTTVEFARHLASRMTVNLAVRRGAAELVEGVNVFASGTLDADALPDADLLIVNADSEEAELASTLPLQKGRPVLFLQGYGEPGNPAVVSNLGRFEVAITGAHWLVDEAARYGCRATHITYGLDRAFFFRGPPAGARPPRVAMMTHVLDWKGTEDGLKALALVRAEVPDVGIDLYGLRDPNLAAARFLPELSGNRPAIGALMRESAAFICSSWEEGFGLSGLEAMSCGAALATTDTKGSRDYAVHGETALVTPPRRPDLLAESVVTLLRDTELRDRIAGRGAVHAAAAYPEWPEAARRLGETLETLVTQ
jgi:Glycosyl transferases group 1